MRIVPLLTLSVFFLSVNAILAQDAGLPPDPAPGKCYVRCIKPDVWENQEIQVLVKPAYKRLEVIPAVYEDQEETVMVKPVTKKYTYVPAEFRTVTREIRIEDPYNEISVTEASLSPSNEEIEVQPSYARYEYQFSLENCQSDDPRDCMVLCYVEYPSQEITIPTEVLASDASTTSSEVGGEMMTYEVQEVVSPARVDEEEIPAEYQTIKKRVLVQDETVREIEVPAEYRTETIRVLTEKGGLAVWEEIDCELTSFTVLPIFYELGSARLTSESRRVIDEKLLELMQAKPLIRVELNAHTDSRGTSESNMDLSQRRSESVVNYLISRGIDRDRLIARGYGETRLVNRCQDGVECSEDEHQRNRRTEFRVLSN